MMHFNNFSPKQLKVLGWWMDTSKHKDKDAIICDGAVRSGKTLCLSLSFVLWALHRFDKQYFAICGKTVSSCRRNVIIPLMEVINNDLAEFGYSAVESVSQHKITVSCGSKSNDFYIFGGRDERSAALIQGVTLAGVLLDEVALMPRSFVEQALARCSVRDSKFWFNCNPDGPGHWFYVEWICKAKDKNAYHLHFAMDDNPSLGEKEKTRYHKLYTGVFYERFILGRWVMATGRVYPTFDENAHTVTDKDIPSRGRYVVSIDHGVHNPCSMGLWRYSGGTAYRIREFYHSGRDSGVQMDDSQYYDALLKLVADEGLRPHQIEYVIADPAASPFITYVYNKGQFNVAKADNSVYEGICNVATMLNQGYLYIHKRCKDSIREFGIYRWDDKLGEDKPIKENDHAMDDIRYFVQTFLVYEKQ